MLKFPRWRISFVSIESWQRFPSWTVVAKDRDQAWGKFVRKYYGQTPLKPNPANFEIVQDGTFPD